MPPTPVGLQAFFFTKIPSIDKFHFFAIAFLGPKFWPLILRFLLCLFSNMSTTAASLLTLLVCLSATLQLTNAQGQATWLGEGTVSPPAPHHATTTHLDHHRRPSCRPTNPLTPQLTSFFFPLLLACYRAKTTKHPQYCTWSVACFGPWSFWALFSSFVSVYKTTVNAKKEETNR